MDRHACLYGEWEGQKATGFVTQPDVEYEKREVRNAPWSDPQTS